MFCDSLLSTGSSEPVSSYTVRGSQPLAIAKKKKIGMKTTASIHITSSLLHGSSSKKRCRNVNFDFTINRTCF